MKKYLTLMLVLITTLILAGGAYFVLAQDKSPVTPPPVIPGPPPPHVIPTQPRHSVPSYIKLLTETDKAKIIQIASEAPDAKQYGGNLVTGYQWVAISESGEVHGMSYDIIEKGIPFYVPIDSRIYPAVVFNSGSWMVSVAVDLETEKIMYTFDFPTGNRFGK